MTDLSRNDILSAADAVLLLKEQRRQRPSAFYKPHAGQEAFHRAKQRIRWATTGNRFGKTTMMAVEFDWWIQKSHPYRVIPDEFIEAWWFCPQVRQFDQLRRQLDASAFTQGYRFNASDMTFTWDGKGKLWIIPQDRDWHYIQGPNPHVIGLDEEPPHALWGELFTRGIGTRATVYMGAMTSTHGLSWVETELYKPWLDHHAARGLGVDQAAIAQLHPDIWFLPEGGVEDNPNISPQEAKRLLDHDYGHPGLNKVRKRGGFAAVGVSSVFDGLALEAMVRQADAFDEARGPGELVGIVGA